MATLFQNLGLSAQFLIAAGAVLSVAMGGMAVWSAVIVSETALKSAAIASSTFMDLVIEPNVQSLLTSDTLSVAAQDQLDRALEEAPLDNRIISVKIWGLDGTIVYSTHRDIVGQKFETDEIARAAAGEIVASYDVMDEDDDEARFERETGLHVIEVYAPLHHYGTGKIVAIGEYYENAQWFEEQRDRSRELTWLVVGGTTLLTLGALFLIVKKGSRTIALQRAELRIRVREAEALALQNDQLRLAAEKDRHDAVDANEKLLSSLGSELHDGPIQLLSVVALRMSMFRRAIARFGQADDPSLDTERMEQIASEVLDNLRNISVGLILPEIDGLSLGAVIELAVVRHRQITGAQVVTHIADSDVEASRSTKICAYRVVQESLNNAHKHAGAGSVMVTSAVTNESVRIAIADEGHGITPTEITPSYHRLGLNGLRNRVHALKGTIEIVSPAVGQGTLVIVELPLQ
ncbi:ATP-binding protein [Devosia sp.]|uniref:sensor histidine kinase n=1 Tax=Devosia sp. TaxID=1871048 RepID=UPI002612A742|nr:ATP-binding protein [Devosia sp.]